MAEKNYPILMDSEILGITGQEIEILKSGRLEARLLETVLMEKKKRTSPFPSQLASLEEKRNELLENLDLDGDIDGSAEALASITVEINEVMARKEATTEVNLDPLREIIRNSFEATNGGIIMPKQIENESNFDLAGASQTEEEIMTSSELALNLVGPVVATSNYYEAAKLESEAKIKQSETELANTLDLSHQIENQISDTSWSTGLTKDEIAAKFSELLGNKKTVKKTISALEEEVQKYARLYDGLVVTLDIRIANLRSDLVDFLVQNPQIALEAGSHQDEYHEEFPNDQVIEPTDIIGGMFTRLTNNPAEEVMYIQEESQAGSYEDPGSEDQYEIESVDWKEIFGEEKYRELMSDRNFAQKYCNAIALVANAGIEVFDMTLRNKSGLYDSRVDYKTAIQILDGLTINDFLSVFTLSKQDISAMRILSLVYRTKIHEFVEPENFTELLGMIKNSELNIDSDAPTLGDAVESYFLYKSYQEYESTEEDPEQDQIQSNEMENEEVRGQTKEQKLEAMAKKIIEMARERIAEQSAAESMNVNFPMSGAAMDKLLGGVARVRHIAEQKGYIERPNDRGDYDELSTIIISYGKTNAEKFQDQKRSWKIIEAIKEAYLNEKKK